MDDLWGNPPPVAQPPHQSNIPSSNSSLVSFSTTDLVNADVHQEQMIIDLAPSVVQVIQWSNQLVTSAWELSDYVPPNLGAFPDRSRLWEGMLIPKLVQALVDDTQARNSVRKAFSSIQTLAVAIAENGNLLSETKGSEKSIMIAREHITKRLEGIKQVIKELQNCQNAALDLFRNHAGEILTIVGPKAADFAKQEAEQQDIIDTENRRMEVEISKYGQLKAQVGKYNNLLHVVSTMLVSSDAALAETRARSQELNQLIKTTEAKVDSIPATVNVQVPGEPITTTTHYGRGWWFWRQSWSTTTTTSTTTTKTIANPDRASQVDYYNSIIAGRTARLTQAQSAEETAALRKKTLEEEKANIQANLTKAQAEFEKIGTQITNTLKEGEEKIQVAIQKIKAIREEANNTENLIGMKGSVLLACLSSIRSFAKAEKNSNLLWQPLIDVLECVTSLCESSVALLGGDKADIFVGVKRLVKNVGFMQSTVSYLTNETTEPEAYKQALASAREKKYIMN